MNGEADPITDDEILYRRIPLIWYDGESVNAQAFQPHKTNDVTGLSISRAKFKTIEEAARGSVAGKSFYVAVLKAGDLRNRGIDIVPRPMHDDPGHTELPQLTADVRKDPITIERQRILAEELTIRVEGPFETAK